MTPPLGLGDILFFAWVFCLSVRQKYHFGSVTHNVSEYDKEMPQYHTPKSNPLQPEEEKQNDTRHSEYNKSKATSSLPLQGD